MNILIYSSALVGLTSRSRGGPSVWIENFAQYLKNNGHNVYGLAIGKLKKQRGIEPYLFDGFYDIQNPLSRLSSVEPLVFTKIVEYTIAARRASKICKINKIDAIISTGVHECAGLYFTELHVPLIISIRGDYTIEIPIWLAGDPNLKRHQKMYDIMEFMALKASSGVTFVSSWLHNQLKSRMLPKKQYIIANPLRTYLSPLTDNQELPLEIFKDKKIIITTSTFHSKHRFEGFKLFVEAARIINQHNPQVHFLVLGGSEEQVYFKRVKELTMGLPITLAGFREDVINTLKKGDVYLHCSVLDTFSNALLEAMSVGLPCVSTKVGGIPEIISHQSDGILTDVDPKSLASETLSLISNQKFAKKLGEAAKEKVQVNYTWDVIGPQWEKIITKAMKN